MENKKCNKWDSRSTTLRYKKANPVASSVQAIFGNVNNKRFRLPNVSIVHTAGNAKTQFTSPKEAKSAAAKTKTVEE